MAPLHRFTSSPHALLLVLAAGAMLCASPGAAAASPRPVLLVIANDDFHHAEFSALRAAMKTRGVPVVVAAGALRPATAQDPGSTPPVFPQRALASVSASDYSAIAFVGGWGSSQYQFAFEGTYHDAAYRPQPAVAGAVNALISAFLAQDKPVAAISHGVSVLAWARVDGVSPLRGRDVVADAGGTPGFRLGNTDFPDAEQPLRWQIEVNGGRMRTSASIGDPLATHDDVIVDGRIITAENVDAVDRFAQTLARAVGVHRN